MKKLSLSLIAIAALTMGATTAAYADAEGLLKDSKCGKCHAADKEKSGPSWKKVAEKYKGKADAEAKLYTHLTTGPKVKVDGEEEVHAKIKSTDEKAIKEVIAFILK
ncbi:MAG: class I cytochrome c [Rhodoferax sp.]|nr:class I cytochrome c [Rhodoferax sp.]